MDSLCCGVSAKNQLMASIENNTTTGRKRGVKGMKKHNMRIDMTPMVDLGFLLITFFVMTARLAEPASMPLYVPADGPPTLAPESASMTVLSNGPDLFYYFGDWEEAVKNGGVVRTSLSGNGGLREVIRNRQAHLATSGRFDPGKPGSENAGSSGTGLSGKPGADKSQAPGTDMSGKPGIDNPEQSRAGKPGMDNREQSRAGKPGKDALMVIMKPGPDTDYNTIVNLMDEMLISNVKRHAMVRITREELAFVKN